MDLSAKLDPGAFFLVACSRPSSVGLRTAGKRPVTRMPKSSLSQLYGTFAAILSALISSVLGSNEVFQKGVNNEIEGPEGFVADP